MEDPPPYCTGPTNSTEPPLTTEDLVARAHAQRQGIPYETREQWLEQLPERLRALTDLVLSGKMQGGDVAYAVAVLIDMIESAVRIEAHDRHGLERLLRYCARPPFAAERLEELDAQRLIYHLPKPGPDGRTQLILTPLELIGRIAALVPPPRQHRHRYYGVLAPNSPRRPAVTALAPHAVAPTPESKPAVETAADDPPQAIRRSPARYLWAMLLARLYQAFPLTRVT